MYVKHTWWCSRHIRDKYEIVVPINMKFISMCDEWFVLSNVELSSKMIQAFIFGETKGCFMLHTWMLAIVYIGSKRFTTFERNKSGKIVQKVLNLIFDGQFSIKHFNCINVSLKRFDDCQLSHKSFNCQCNPKLFDNLPI